jgi:metal-responsive CopG/Arc/MetJ family transcriptional regulator
VKVGATLDPELVAAVDRYVDEHPGRDRSSVIDEALQLWYARQQDEAMERQLLAPRSATERREAAAWARIRAAAAQRLFEKRSSD